jgi:glycosyltransferase involved in cell wall biosynthesis
VKLAFVVQRYGAAIAGGSETHCRLLAEHLAPFHDITVLTTCARDYVTWRNHYPPGETLEDGVRVIRFPVARRRRLKAFADLSDEVFSGGAPPEREERWFRENGPETPGLLDHLRRHGAWFDLVLFWAYRYFPTYFGVPLVADRAVLVPTAEEDPAIDLAVLGDYFRLPAGFLFLTPEEEALVSSRAGQPLGPSAIIGSGLHRAPEDKPSTDTFAHLSIPTDYALYLGRIDRNKGCQTLFEYFHEYVDAGGSLTLVLAGPAAMPVPRHERVRPIGYVPDDVRNALLAHARLLVVPSPYESLSIALLEAWNVGVPALVNGRCKVLRGQALRANGGLCYRSSLEFREALDYLSSHPSERTAMGRQGRAYVDREYRWPTVVERVETLLQKVQEGRCSGKGSARP